MTLTQARNKLRIELDKTVATGLPSFIDSELNCFLEKAQEMLMRKKVSQYLSPNTDPGVFNVLDADLKPLHYYLEASTLDTKVSKNSYLFDYGNSVDFSAVLNIFISYSETSVHPVKTIKAEDADAFMHTDENIPWIPEAVGIHNRGKKPAFTSNYVVFLDPDIVSKGFDSGYPKLNVDCINKPSFPSSDSAEFSVDWVDEIISLAASIALDNIESPRVQTHAEITATNTN